MNLFLWRVLPSVNCLFIPIVHFIIVLCVGLQELGCILDWDPNILLLTKATYCYSRICKHLTLICCLVCTGWFLSPSWPNAFLEARRFPSLQFETLSIKLTTISTSRMAASGILESSLQGNSDIYKKLCNNHHLESVEIVLGTDNEQRNVCSRSFLNLRESTRASTTALLCPHLSDGAAAMTAVVCDWESKLPSLSVSSQTTGWPTNQGSPFVFMSLHLQALRWNSSQM